MNYSGKERASPQTLETPLPTCVRLCCAKKKAGMFRVLLCAKASFGVCRRSQQKQPSTQTLKAQLK